MSFNAKYRIADKCIEIQSLFSMVHELCKDYCTDGVPELTVTITQACIDYERKKSAREDAAEGIPVRQFSDDYLETLAVYRKIAEWMPGQETILFHGSCVAVDGEGYLFAARSGTGKSTHTGLWREMLGDRAVMVNDDKPLLRVENTITVYGTPWDGKHRLSKNISVPLKGLCILERAEENRIQRISKEEALPMLIQQVYRPADPMAMVKTMELIDRLGQGVSLYRMGCNMDIGAAEMAYEEMRHSI